MLKSRVPRRFRKVRGRFTAGNSVTFLRDGREAFPAMLSAIEQAEQQILLEMYWFDADRIGRRFAEALGRARARGVEVAVIYDSVGSLGVDRSMFAELEAKGCFVHEFNPVAPWTTRFSLARLTLRDHRKILVVDGSLGFTGGINISDRWLPLSEGGDAWRDDMVRIQGLAVGGLTRCFHHAWRRQGRDALPRLAPRPYVAKDGEAVLPVRIVGERYFRNRHEISRNYVSRIYAAKARVYIANSYFVPDAAVLRALERAARRGVEVCVVVPARSDVEAVRHAGRAIYGRLLEAGVRIFEWQDGMYHAKSATIDGQWSTIGTFNFDYMSLRSNLEVNASILDPEFAQLMESSFRLDFARSREIELEQFQLRSLSDRLLESAFYRLRKFL